MRSCLQCRAVTSREGGEGGIWNLHSLSPLFAWPLFWWPPHTHKTRWSKERSSSSSSFLLPFFWGFFSLVASVPPTLPVSTQRMWRRITSSSSFGRSAWWLPLEILCSLSSRVRPSISHLSPVSPPLHGSYWHDSVPISGPLFRPRFSMHQITHTTIWPVCTP